MFNKKLILTSYILLILSSTLCMAQETNDVLRQEFATSASFGKPCWSDMHSTLIIAYATNSPDYDWAGVNKYFRPFIFTNLGVDIPIWSGNFSDGKFGLSFTLPFLVDLWLNRFDGDGIQIDAVINTSSDLV